MLGYAFICDMGNMPGTIFAFTLYVNFRCLSYFVVDTFMKLVMQAMFEGIHEVQNPEQYVTIWVGFFEKATYVLYALVLLAEVLIFRRLLKSGGKINWIECGYLSVLNIAGFFLTINRYQTGAVMADAGHIAADLSWRDGCHICVAGIQQVS